MNLLIVEDEQNSREGLLNCIDGFGLGLTVKAVKNGSEALEILDAFKPDIVVTDIKMPKMNGIELAEELRNRFGEIRIVFISGYDDKEYLMNAIRMKIDNYLLKPVSLEELEKTMKEIVSELKEKQSSQLSGVEIKHKYKMGVTLLCDDFSRNLIEGKLTDANVISSWINKLDMPISPDGKCYAAVLVKIDSIENEFDTTCYDDQRLIDFSIRNITDEIISGYTDGYTFRYSDDMYLCILSFENEKAYYEHIGELTLKIRDSLAKYISIITTVSVGKSVTGIRDLKKSFRQAKKNIQKGQTVAEEEKERKYIDRYVPQELYDELETAIRNGDYRATEMILQEVMDTWKDCEENGTGIGYMLSYAVYTVLSTAQQLKLKTGTERKLQALYNDFLDSASADHSLQIILDMTGSICNDLNFDEGNNEKIIVEKIKDQLESHYSEDISISKIAGSVYLSSTYVCILFKKHMGMTINEYLSHVRIERAKALLQNSSHTVAEVALSVGYHDPKYFSRIFRKTVGVPPSEYFQY